MPVTYEELQGSPSEELTLDGWVGTRTLKCAWDERITLIQELWKQEYPVVTIPRLICTTCTASPFPGKNTGSGDTSSYEYSIVVVKYTTPSFSGETGQGSGPQISESIEPTAEFITGSNLNLRWNGANSGKLVTRDEAPGKLMIGFDYVYAIEGLQILPDAILSLIGYVNDKIITPTSQGMDQFKFDPETLLFNPPSISRTFNEYGVSEWNLAYRFTYKPNWDDTVAPAVARGWNWYWRVDKDAGVAKFDSMFVDGGDEYKQYPSADFAATGIFQ